MAVLIGAFSDITPTGHHSITLVVGSGGYGFTEHVRLGAILVVIVISGTAAVLSAFYG